MSSRRRAFSRERRKAYEKALALKEADPFPFFLAEKLGMTVADLRARMSYDEYVQWRAFWSWRNWMNAPPAQTYGRPAR